MKPHLLLFALAATLPCYAENTVVKPVERTAKNPETAKPVQVAVVTPVALKIANSNVNAPAPTPAPAPVKAEVKVAAPSSIAPAPATVAAPAPVAAAPAKEEVAPAPEAKPDAATLAAGLMAPVIADDGMSQKEVMARYLSAAGPAVQRPGMQLGVADVITLTKLETIKVSK